MTAELEVNKIYQEVLEIQRVEFGWPDWPPKEEPQLTRWWQNSLEVLPKKPHRSYIRFIDIAATPKAGKTTLATIANNVLSQEFSKMEWNLELLDQPFLMLTEGALMVNLELIYPPSVFPDDEIPPIFSKSDSDAWYESIFIEQWKSLYWQKAYFERL